VPRGPPIEEQTSPRGQPNTASGVRIDAQQVFDLLNPRSMANGTDHGLLFQPGAYFAGKCDHAVFYLNVNLLGFMSCVTLCMSLEDFFNPPTIRNTGSWNSNGGAPLLMAVRARSCA
jgi:hypothetical protein